MAKMFGEGYDDAEEDLEAEELLQQEGEWTKAEWARWEQEQGPLPSTDAVYGELDPRPYRLCWQVPHLPCAFSLSFHQRRICVYYLGYH